MGTVLLSTYSINFSDESIEDVREEIKMRAALRQELGTRMDQRVKSMAEYLHELPEEVQQEFRDFCEDVHDLSYESFHYGRAQMYEHIADSIKHLLGRIVKRLFLDMNVPVGKKALANAISAATFSILKDETMMGSKKANIARKHGHNRAYWTRVSKGELAQSYAESMKAADQSDQSDSNEEGAPMATDLESTEVEVIDIAEVGPGITSQDIERRDQMAEGSQNWRLAMKLLKSMGLEPAVEFLRKSGASGHSIQKFREEAKTDR